MKIAVTGSRGLVGSRVIELLKNEFEFIPLSSEELDITEKKAVETKLDSVEYDLLLHLAAYTNVEGAENEKEKAHAINVDGTKNLLDHVIKEGKKMIYVSTDFVFDGKLPPYDEKSMPNPVGYYGKSKFEGEEIVKGKAMIVRISYPYGAQSGGKPDFVERLKSILKLGKPLTMIADAAMTPTFIDDIAYGLSHLMKNFKPEIYHLVGGKSYTPFEVGGIIAKKCGLPESLILPTTFAEYSKGKSPRPQYSIIMTSKNDFYKMRTFEEGVNSVAS
ncbi:NAD(P)-dependent oxidoreductase [Candidatus Woesebacteria bacterium]|nr:NAD(P)-dependent oxidoreductase [Candidatus Woesebacteria bacterium]